MTIVTLLSPVGSESLSFNLSEDGRYEGQDVLDVIKCVCKVIPENIRLSIIKYVIVGFNVENVASIVKVCETYNRCMGAHLQIQNGKPFPNFVADTEIIKHIIQLAYQKSVTEPEKLNHYQPFSAEVYGETSFEFVEEMLETLSFKPDDCFVDLGSGVGQVVMQVAASKKFKICYGIEKAETPYSYSKNMEKEFKMLMKFYGLQHSPFALMKGDFIHDEFNNIINESMLIFVNNFAFGPHLNHGLKMKFANLKEGVRIVSSREFCPLNFRITDRNLSDFGAIVKVSQFTPMKDAVSWTDKAVSYFLHIIDRTILESFFTRKKRNQPFKSPFSAKRFGKTMILSSAKKKWTTLRKPLFSSSTETSSTRAKTTPPTLDYCENKSTRLIRMEDDLKRVLEAHRIAYTLFLNDIQSADYVKTVLKRIDAETGKRDVLAEKRDDLLGEIENLKVLNARMGVEGFIKMQKLFTDRMSLMKQESHLKMMIELEEKALLSTCSIDENARKLTFQKNIAKTMDNFPACNGANLTVITSNIAADNLENSCISNDSLELSPPITDNVTKSRIVISSLSDTSEINRNIEVYPLSTHSYNKVILQSDEPINTFKNMNNENKIICNPLLYSQSLQLNNNAIQSVSHKAFIKNSPNIAQIYNNSDTYLQCKQTSNSALLYQCNGNFSYNANRPNFSLTDSTFVTSSQNKQTEICNVLENNFSQNFCFENTFESGERISTLPVYSQTCFGQSDANKLNSTQRDLTLNPQCIQSKESSVLKSVVQNVCINNSQNSTYNPVISAPNLQVSNKNVLRGLGPNISIENTINSTQIQASSFLNLQIRQSHSYENQHSTNFENEQNIKTSNGNMDFSYQSLNSGPTTMQERKTGIDNTEVFTLIKVKTPNNTSVYDSSIMNEPYNTNIHDSSIMNEFIKYRTNPDLFPVLKANNNNLNTLVQSESCSLATATTNVQFSSFNKHTDSKTFNVMNTNLIKSKHLSPSQNQVIKLAVNHSKFQSNDVSTNTFSSAINKDPDTKIRNEVTVTNISFTNQNTVLFNLVCPTSFSTALLEVNEQYNANNSITNLGLIKLGDSLSSTKNQALPISSSISPPELNVFEMRSTLRLPFILPYTNLYNPLKKSINLDGNI